MPCRGVGFLHFYRRRRSTIGSVCAQVFVAVHSLILAPFHRLIVSLYLTCSMSMTRPITNRYKPGSFRSYRCARCTHRGSADRAEGNWLRYRKVVRAAGVSAVNHGCGEFRVNQFQARAYHLSQHGSQTMHCLRFGAR